MILQTKKPQKGNTIIILVVQMENLRCQVSVTHPRVHREAADLGFESNSVTLAPRCLPSEPHGPLKGRGAQRPTPPACPTPPPPQPPATCSPTRVTNTDRSGDKSQAACGALAKAMPLPAPCRQVSPPLTCPSESSPSTFMVKGPSRSSSPVPTPIRPDTETGSEGWSGLSKHTEAVEGAPRPEPRSPSASQSGLHTGAAFPSLACPRAHLGSTHLPRYLGLEPEAKLPSILHCPAPEGARRRGLISTWEVVLSHPTPTFPFRQP